MVTAICPSRGLIFAKTIQTIWRELRDIQGAELIIVSEKPIPDAQNEAVYKALHTQNELFFFFEELAKQEKLEVTKEDLDNELEKIAQSSSKNAEEIKDYYKKHDLLDDLKYKIKEDKIYNLIIENSKIEEKEPTKEDLL